MRVRRVISAVLLFAVLVFSAIFSPAKAVTSNEPVFVCNSVTFPAADDSSFRLDLPFSLTLGQHEYTDVFASTNGLISFGAADITYWDYPSTPSISLAGNDWVTWGSGAYMRYGTTANTLCIEWAVRPYPNSSGAVTYITFQAVHYSNGFWTGEVTVTGANADAGYRRGIRYSSSEPVVVMDATFQVGTNGVPVETKTCWDNSVIPTTEQCQPEPDPQLMIRPVICTGPNPYTGLLETWGGSQHYNLYWDGREVDVDTYDQACIAGTPNFPEPLPTVHSRDVICRGTDTNGQDVTWLVSIRYNLYWDGRTEDLDDQTQKCIDSDTNLNNVDAIVVLDNGVELTVTVAEALQLFDSPSDLLNAIFVDPGQVITAVLNIGADMTPAQRKQSQRAIIPAVVVTQVITSTSAITLIRR